MAVTWSATEVIDPATGRARFVDEKGNRGVRVALTANNTGTYTTGGDNLPVLHFAETRNLRVVSDNNEQVRSKAEADVTISNASATLTLSATAGDLTAADIGRVVVGTNIPANTHIIAVASATSATMSANASGVASGTYFIGGTDASTPRPRVNTDNCTPVLDDGVPGKLKLFVNTTAAELANATDISGTSFLVEILGK